MDHEEKIVVNTLESTSASAQFFESLVSSINAKINLLPPNPSKSYGVCIFEVSEKHRQVNEDAYTPRLISIGPLHRGKPHLQGMEVYKLRYLQNFMARFGVSLNILLKVAVEAERYVRRCYQNTINLSSQAFLEMILLDGVFIVELFFKNHFHQMRGSNDALFDNRWMRQDLLHDMLLLENQIPLRFTSKIFSYIDGSFLGELSLYDLAHHYFQDVGNTGKVPLPEYCEYANHLVEFLLFLHQPSEHDEPLITDATRECTHCATKLQAAGVKFCRGKEDSLLQISFRKGELSIPQLTVNESTETFFRNLMAFELCSYNNEQHISSYVILLGSLINTAKDVELLAECGIINNMLGSSERVAILFSYLQKEVAMEIRCFSFERLCIKLNNYSRSYLHRWKSKWFRWRLILTQDYFGNPWSIISVIAAVVLLVLTVIQTVCSLMSV